MAEQFDLFNQKNLNPIDGLKEAMRVAIKTSGLSRDQVADLMNELAEKYGVPSKEGNSKGITVDIIEKWIAPSATNLVSIKLIPIFCEATKSVAPIEVLAQAIGGQLITGDDITLLKLAQVEQKSKELRHRKRILELQLQQK
ncbi:MAG: hypothetical protein G3M70_07090 [Candidatus Nitronauta litoralis]|uniref:Uncharacterized protein n=1 Tax=Candidatus Nitronauta litoralis TaxID=2705533 RepID=A0A7T0BVD1_9BACT|nr:MAG: hypothetical protein G3M70_07090 [Candidatus Nitronauta litoralis]